MSDREDPFRSLDEARKVLEKQSAEAREIECRLRKRIEWRDKIDRATAWMDDWRGATLGCLAILAVVIGTAYAIHTTELPTQATLPDPQPVAAPAPSGSACECSCDEAAMWGYLLGGATK